MRAAFPRAACVVALLFAVSSVGTALANPEGGSVAAGKAVISGEGTSRVTVTQSSSRAVIDWNKFSIGAGETTRFIQPNSDSIAANRVVGISPSRILGRLEANGRVVLINRNGILFGRDARVDAAGLIATVHDLPTASFMEDSSPRFDIPGDRGASVVNAGSMTMRDAGLAALVAPRVRNDGAIRAGRVVLAGAGGFAVDLNGDGLLSFAPGDALKAVSGDGALVEVGGRIEADGGEVLLSARAAEAVVNASVNVAGLVRARRVSETGGVIRLEGPGEVRISSGATLDASGRGDGGEIVIEGGQLVSDGDVLAESTHGAGGQVRIRAGRAGLGGRISASGRSGGAVGVETARVLSLGERVEARGEVGRGGAVAFAAGRIVETMGASVDVSGFAEGGRIAVDGGLQLATSGDYRASSLGGAGGRIDLGAADIRLLSARLDASAAGRGGLVRIGGAAGGGTDPASGASEMGLSRRALGRPGGARFGA